MIVPGLDRTDDNPFLLGMADELWQRHTQEIQSEISKTEAAGNAVNFTTFCRDYFTGEKKTAAMLEYALWRSAQKDQEEKKDCSRGWRGEVILAMEEMYPLTLAEKWDNVGLLIDDLENDSKELDSTKPKVVMLTNDLTEVTLSEAMSCGATLVITYHPRPFGKFNRLVRNDVTQRIVLQCIKAGIMVYSPHTACDNAAGGVNDWLANGLSGGSVVKPVKLFAGYGQGVGNGRIFDLPSPVSVEELVKRVKQHLNLAHVRVAPSNALIAAAAGNLSLALAMPATCKSVAVQAGSGANTLVGCGADVWVTGEASHHEVLEANAAGTTVILTDHSNTERGYLPHMRIDLLKKLRTSTSTRSVAHSQNGVNVLVSCSDCDPLRVV